MLLPDLRRAVLEANLHLVKHFLRRHGKDAYYGQRKEKK